MKQNEFMNKHVSGYTIVELLIVLAVTGVIAISAFTLVGGQQARNEFAQSVRDFEVKLADVANDVAKGYYPNIGDNQRCIVNPQGMINFPGGPAGAEQGGSPDCIFAGKAIQLAPAGDEDTMRIVVLAAARTIDGRPNPGILSDDFPKMNGIRPVDALEESLPLKYQLRVRSVNGVNSPGGIAFLSGFSSVSGGAYTGAPETNLYTLLSTQLLQNPTPFNNVLRDKDNYVPNAGGIEICLEQGAGGRTAVVRVGTAGRELNVIAVIGEAC